MVEPSPGSADRPSDESKDDTTDEVIADETASEPASQPPPPRLPTDRRRVYVPGDAR